MTESQAEFTVASLIILLVIFIWMTVYYYRKTGSPSDTGVRLSGEDENRMDRDEIVRRVALMDEVSSKEVYKKVYHITEDELAAYKSKGKH